MSLLEGLVTAWVGFAILSAGLGFWVILRHRD
jgi:hypothetical protein